MSFFSKVSWRSLCCHAHIWSNKKVTSVELHSSMGPKKSKGCPFFSDFWGKALMPIFCHNNFRFLKNSVLSWHFFFNFSWKTYNSHAHIWSKKCQSCKHYLILWAKKVNVTKKSMLLWHAHILSKNFHSLKKLCPHSHILSKKHPLSQKRGVLMSFFWNITWKTPCFHAHIWSKIKSILSKLRYNMGQKKSLGTPFFPILNEKMTAHMPIFWQKTSNL